MDEKELKALERRFDDRYVKQSECGKIVSDEDKKIHKVEIELNAVKVQLAKVDVKLGVLIGILSSVAVPVVALCVKLLFGG